MDAEAQKTIDKVRGPSTRMQEFVAAQPQDASGAFTPVKGHRYTQEERTALWEAQGEPLKGGGRVEFPKQDKNNNESMYDYGKRLDQWYQGAGLSHNTRNPLNDPEFRLGKK